ncbi:hypothetical protein HpSIM50_15660 [Helicobacter pylori]
MIEELNKLQANFSQLQVIFGMEALSLEEVTDRQYANGLKDGFRYASILLDATIKKVREV